MKSFILALFPLLLLAQVPKAFIDLGDQIESERPVYLSLLEHHKFQRHFSQIDTYFGRVDEAFEIGIALDKEIESEEGLEEEKLFHRYLDSLRTLDKDRSSLRTLYYDEVFRSIQEQEKAYFLFLIEQGNRFVQENVKLRRAVLAYGKKIGVIEQNSYFKRLQAEKELDERSYVFSQKMHDEYRAYQEVLRKAEALKLRQLLVAKRKGGVIVYAHEAKGDIDFYIENLFEMHVSATLHMDDIQGYTTETDLPFRFILRPKQKIKALHLKNSDVNKHVGSFNSHISWVKGSVHAKHDAAFIYALPFQKSHKVSQGFNGNTSHKGNAKYAIDFAMDNGTPVYAARGGKVVEIVQEHTKHGMALSMRRFANYVIVEHEDKTLGRYFHLQHNGVKVHLGDTVEQGQLIALSGNTGRTSGPHLHFVVTKAEYTAQGYDSVSVPIKFVCSEGIIDNPVSGKEYCTYR